ncbi:DUF4345 family protein [bacterium SCSIO 12741]|nr:DUF4345 family protein [bacterium SCSIO 12741]
MEIVKMATLGLSGTLLVFVGSMRLFNPIKTYLKNSGITIDNNVDLLNEMRGVSAVMLVGGLLLFLGILLPQLAHSSFMVGALIFLGFAVGRIFGMMTDGRPNKQIVQGLGFEIVLGSANLVCWIMVAMG